MHFFEIVVILLYITSKLISNFLSNRLQCRIFHSKKHQKHMKDIKINQQTRPTKNLIFPSRPLILRFHIYKAQVIFLKIQISAKTFMVPMKNMMKEKIQGMSQQKMKVVILLHRIRKMRKKKRKKNHRKVALLNMMVNIL